MNEHESKPRVTPPAAYKAPSLPTLAALGAISAAALLNGCARAPKMESVITMGLPINPIDRLESTEEKNEPSPALPSTEEKFSEEITDGLIDIEGE